MTVHALINEVANGRHKAYFDKDLRSSPRPWSAAEKEAEFDPAIALAAPLAGVPEEDSAPRIAIPGGKMTKTVDKAALELALEIARSEPARGKQLDEKLKDKSWRAVAEFAAYCCQCRSLKLWPWEDPPCHSEPDGDGPGSALLRKMIAAGISVSHPDPLAALAEAAA